MSLHETSTQTTVNFHGISPPLLLPLKSGGAIDFEGFERYVEWHLAAGVQGLWINGSSGVFFQLDESERLEAARVAIGTVSGRVPVTVHVGASGSRLALRHARNAAAAGADAIAAIPPFYMPHNQEELKRHYRALANEAQLPLFIYNVPHLTGNPLTIDSILELASEGILAGFKESGGSLDFQMDLIRSVTDLGLPLHVFNGTSKRFEEGFRIGACGFMGAISNIIPHRCRLGYDAYQLKEWDELHEINRPILELLRIYNSLSGPSFEGYMKWLLKEMGVIPCAEVFGPDRPVLESEEEYLRRNALPLVSGV